MQGRAASSRATTTNLNALSGNSGSITGTAPDSSAGRQSASANAGWNVVADASGTAANAFSTITVTLELNTAALELAANHYR